jgi:hypothetical protein
MSTEETPALVVAGWVVVSPTKWPAGFDSLVPDPFMTVSYCLADDLVTPEFEWWFQNLDEAKAARTGSADLLGLGLASNDAATFMAEVAYDRVFEELRRRQTAQPTALLGFEIVGGEEFGLSLHSWHCHGYASDAWSELGIGVNDLGLVSEYAEAVRILEWMMSRPPGEEPRDVPWTIVALWRESEE